MICRIAEDEDMPTDDYGFRADLVVDPGSVISRMNTGQLNMQAINRISEFVRRRLEHVFADNPKKAAELLLDYYNDINPNYAKLVRQVRNTDAKLIDHVKWSIENGVHLNIPPFLETFYDKEGEESIFLRLMKKWEVEISPVTYTVRGDAGGDRTARSEQPVCIGSKYMFLLCKLPEPSSPGVARTSHHGIPMKTPSDARSSSAISANPTRFGEDEFRILDSDVDSVENFRLMCLQSASPEGVDRAINSLLHAANPTQLDRITISTEELRDTNAVLGMWDHMMSTEGIDTRNTEVTIEDFPELMLVKGLDDGIDVEEHTPDEEED